jgi:ribosomal protein S14
MTAKNFAKAKTQLGSKPAKWNKYVKHNKPKVKRIEKGDNKDSKKSLEQYGRGANRCRFTLTSRGVIRKYGLQICRRTFRLNAQKLGFKKLD